jgi:hypothetical protein
MRNVQPYSIVENQKRERGGRCEEKGEEGEEKKIGG